jgi:peptide/nickel transport system substrate-binding protein
MKKILKTISILVLVSMLLSACNINTKSNTEVEENPYEEKYDVIDKGPVKGGVVRLFTTQIDTLNPILTNNSYVQDFLGLVFEGLYKLDSNQNLVPVLAKSSDLSTDGLTLTIYLKDNIKWHDNIPLTPDDVVFTINTIMDAKNNSIYLQNVQNILSVAAGGNNSVIIKLKKQYSFIRNELVFPIIPMHNYINQAVGNKTSKSNLSPVGTGPYVFTSYDPKTSVKLKLNEEWWNAEGENGGSAASSSNTKKSDILLPYIANIEIKIYKNSNDANAAFQTGDINVFPADYNDYRKYIGRTDITMKRYTGRNYEFLSLNIKSGPLADKRVRNAINILINKSQLVDTAATGIAQPAEIPVIPNSWIYQLVNLGQSTDMEKAKQLLKQSGYVFDSAKNKYVRKNTKNVLTLKLLVNDDNSLRFSVATEIAAQLSKNGINVQISRIPWADEQKKMKAGAYDMAIMGYRISSIPDLSFAYSSTEIKSGLNTAGYSNAAVDSILQSILIEQNADNQKALYVNLLNTITDERPYIGLFFLNDSVMYSRNIRGAINPYIWDKYYDISQWYIP